MADDNQNEEIERLRAENLRLKKQSLGKGMTMKVSEKGGLSVYGLGRFPVTLYKEQWTKLLENSEVIREFLKQHDADLKTKGDASPAAPAEAKEAKKEPKS